MKRKPIILMHSFVLYVSFMIICSQIDVQAYQTNSNSMISFTNIDYLNAVETTGLIKDQSRYTVNVAKTTVRTGPGKNYKKAFSLYKGNVVIVYEIQNGWAEIRISNHKYYIPVSAIQ